MPDRSTYYAERIRSILDQYPADDELRQRLLNEVQGLEQPSNAEILPPNIPVNPEELRQQLENAAEAETNGMNKNRLSAMAAGVPRGHPGVDYTDAPEKPGHERRQQTSQGVPVNPVINELTTGRA